MRKQILMCAVLLGMVACKQKQPEVPPANLYFAVYSNPTMDAASIHVNNETQAPCTLRVFDPQGERVASHVFPEGESDVTIDLTRGPEGTYDVVLSSVDGDYVKHIIKLKR